MKIKKLLQMQKFLEEIGLNTNFDNDGKKLYLLDSKDKHVEILNKCDELGITYVQARDPYYGATDPITLEQPIIGFIKSEWFEVRK